jgi:uncharacterized delta-60 repeat protein
MIKNFLFLTLFLTAAGAGFSQVPVMPDSTFNGTGRKIFSCGGSLSYGDNVAIQADGKIIMTGASLNLGGNVSLGVSRMNADGSFDNSFGTSGISLVDLGGLTYQGGFEPEIVIQPDGKILICGFGDQTPGDDDMLVCRLLSNGTPDPSFGTGGKALVGLAGPGMPDAAYALTTDAVGNIYACGASRTGGTPFTNDVAIIKLTPAGVLDPTFSGDGKLLLDISGGSWDFGYGIAVRTDGKIIVTGYAGLPADIFAIRLMPDGSYDPTFSGDGKVTIDIFGANLADEAWGMNMTPDGKILIVGDAYNPSTSAFNACIVRLTEDGLPDPAFSTDGIATFAFSDYSDVMRNVIVQPDGKYLVSGNAQMSATNDFAVMRLNPDGTLDPSFNFTGMYTLDVSGLYKDDLGYGLAMQSDGRFLLSGNTTYSEFSDQKYSLVRLIDVEILAAFTASDELICNGSQVQFTNNSMGENLSYLWTFEGGTPATSTMLNPLVTYNTPGIFDVKLVTYNSTVSDSLLNTNLIEVITTPDAPVAPSGPTQLCNSQTYQYTTSVVPGADSYNWLVLPSSAGTIAGNATTATYTASPAWTGAFTIKVNATNQCGNSAWSEVINITQNHMPVAYMLQGDGYYCQGSAGATITLASSEIGIDYQLQFNDLPSGAIIPGTGSALVWNNLTDEGFYTVDASSASCSQSMAGQIYVTMITAPAQPGVPVGAAQVCNDIITTYNTISVPNAVSYEWTLNPANAGSIVANGVQASITWNNAFNGTADLSVVAVNDCGSSSASPSLAIAVNDTPEPAVSGLTIVCQNWDADYQTTVNAGSSYVWTVTGGNIVSGAGTALVKVNWNVAGTGTLKVVETSANACAGASAIYSVAVNPCVGIDEPTAGESFNVFPNPVHNLFTVKLSEKSGNNSQLRLIDPTGRMVASFAISDNSTLIEGIDISKLKSGFYTLQYVNDGKVVSQTKVVKY